MDTAVSIIALIFLVAIALCIIALIPLALTYQIWTKKLAERKPPLLVKIMKEGEGSWIERNGKAWRYITSDAKTDPDPDDDKCDVTDEGLAKWSNPTGKLRTPGGKHEPWWVQWIDDILPGGMRWVGVPWIYSIYEYNFRRAELRSGEPQPTENGIIPGATKQLESGKWVAFFAERIDFNFLRDSVYYFNVSEAETKGADSDSQDKSVGMAVSIDMLATVRIVNPYRTFFVVHDWLESTLALLGPSIRSWIASKPYQEVVGKPEVAERGFDEFLKHAPSPTQGKCILQYLEETYGVRVKRIAFAAVVPPDEYAAATTRRAEAVQDAVRIVTLAGAAAQQTVIAAEASAKAKIIDAKAEAESIELQVAAIDKGGETGRFVKHLEAVVAVGANGNGVYLMGNGDTSFPMLLPSPKNLNAAPPQPPAPGTNRPPRQGRRP